MKPHVTLLAAVLLAVPPLPAANIRFVQHPDKVDILVDSAPLATYLYAQNLPKPSLIALRSASGLEVTRRWPLTDLDGGSSDHLHHVGVFFCVDRVNGTNFWNYQKNPDGGEPKIKHIRFDQITAGADRGVLRTVSTWIDKHGRALLEESRTMTFLAGEHPTEYAIDLDIDLTAEADSVLFEDIEEGMLGIRVSDYLREPRDAPRVRPGQPLPPESVRGTGTYFSSNGDQTAAECWGKRARWVALQGVKDSKVVGIAVLNHPESLNYPTYWHVRDYGLFSANPLGQGDFQRQSKYKKNAPIPLRITLERGKTAHFRFRLIVYEGIRSQQDIEDRFRTFIRE